MKKFAILFLFMFMVGVIYAEAPPPLESDFEAIEQGNFVLDCQMINHVSAASFVLYSFNPLVNVDEKSDLLERQKNLKTGSAGGLPFRRGLQIYFLS